jgi:large subunit ribosomal protein L4
MTTVEIRTPAGDTDGAVELPADLFDVAVSEPLIHQVVVAQLAAARSGNHSSKTKAEVRGGGRKPYRQKGTGRARQGSTRAPQFAGGGTVHGPTPRDYSQRTPKKMKAAALRQILSDRARNDRISVISAVIDGETPSTKSALATLGDWMADGRILLVLDPADNAGWRSLRNINAVQLASVEQFNAYDVVVSDRVVFSKDALESFVARGSKASKQGSDA